MRIKNFERASYDNLFIHVDWHLRRRTVGAVYLEAWEGARFLQGQPPEYVEGHDIEGDLVNFFQEEQVEWDELNHPRIQRRFPESPHMRIPTTRHPLEHAIPAPGLHCIFWHPHSFLAFPNASIRTESIRWAVSGASENGSVD